MGPVLNGLVDLQSVENRLRGMKSKLNRARRIVVLHENQLRGFHNALEEKRHEIQLTRIKIDNLELELKSRDAEVQKYRTALNSAKSNKEYAAILTELNTNKADNSKIENQTLELMRAIELEEAACVEIESQIEEGNAKLEEIKAKSADDSKEFVDALADIQKEWDSTAEEIPGEALGLFKKLSETYDGEALAFVEQADSRRTQYSCSGCYMSITNETVNQLLSNDDLIQCPSCSRIVVLKERFEQ